MGDFVPLLGDWVWWVVAGVLLLLELVAPGVFFIWLAAAAAAVGLLDIAFNMGWHVELIAFAALALASVFVGKRVLKTQHVLDSDAPNLNQRMYEYVGRTYPLHQPIINGRGRISVDSTLWEITGPDTPMGTQVKVIAVDGLRLKVERDAN